MRRRCGVAPVYISRALIGDVGCGSAGERDNDVNPDEVLLRR